MAGLWVRDVLLIIRTLLVRYALLIIRTLMR